MTRYDTDIHMKDYYSILGVDKNASQEDIQKAFRKLAHKYHPDKKDGDVNKFKEVNEAYQVLSNQQKRARYDAGFGGGFSGDNFNGFDGFDFSNFDIKFSGSEHAGGNFADMINSIFRGAMNRGADAQVDIIISFEESIFGVQKKIRIPYRRKAEETIEVQIPAGTESGTALRLSGRGEPSKDGRSQPGDLYIRVRVQEDNRFQRHGGDIVTVLELMPTEALLGTKKEIRDVRGEKLIVAVPKMSTDGTTIIFSDKGIPQPAGTGRLVVLCKIVYPKSMTGKVQTLLESLQKEGW